MRQKQIDILKGISIICIVLLHFEDGIFPSFMNVAIGSFMISAFYFTSGWLMDASGNKRTMKEHIKKRWKSLGLPYLWFSLIFIAFDILLYLFGVYNEKYILREVYKTIILRGIGTLWFIPALFGGEIIWLYLKDKKTILKLLILIISLLYINIYHLFFDGKVDDLWRIIDAPFRVISNISTAWIVIAIGYYIHKYGSNTIHSLNKWQATIMGLLSVSLGFLLCNYGHFPSLGITGFLWSMLSYAGIMIFVMPWQNSFICRYFEYWGRNSLILMLTHYTIILELCVCLNNYLTKTSDIQLHGWVAIFYFVITMIIEYPIVWFINHKAKFLIGK